jgi:predicted HTH transcriptional regulator
MINGFGSTSEEKAKTQKELCCDVTQFANHLGGCLLIGFSEVKNQDRLNVASEFTPVQGPDSLREWIEQAITNYCTPHTFTHHIEIIPYREGFLLAINVPASRIPVILWDRPNNTMQAVGRNNHGKTYLNPSELENLRMNGSRAAKIAFDASIPTHSEKRVNLVPGLLQWDNSNQKWFSTSTNDSQPHSYIHNVT